MKIIVVCVNSEKRIKRLPGGKSGGFIHRSQFEAATVEDAPENKKVYDSTPALALDIPNHNGPAFDVGKQYTVTIE